MDSSAEPHRFPLIRISSPTPSLLLGLYIVCLSSLVDCLSVCRSVYTLSCSACVSLCQAVFTLSTCIFVHESACRSVFPSPSLSLSLSLSLSASLRAPPQADSLCIVTCRIRLPVSLCRRAFVSVTIPSGKSLPCVYLAPGCLSQSPQDCMSVSIPISVSTCMSLCLRVFVLLCLSMRLRICVMAVHSVSLSVSPRHYLSVSVSVLRRLQRQRQRRRRRNILVGCLLWGVPPAATSPKIVTDMHPWDPYLPDALI